jgi:excisionase family DNA binding protein
MERILITVQEAATYLSIGRTKASELVGAGIIPSIRIGRSVRVPVKQLDELVEKAKDNGDQMGGKS